ncbi:hypothetical protein GCM10009775_15830 [Microbacterium aoyamense]|uniref:Uncharacterized protein n=1 Tax=Microbacterium aoyamense TaxID=344166 RepID=A0ABP5AWP8_9MICO|nr:DUF6716 putative glycosyltransferase [Microbacterium aoyamense]
MTRLRVVGVADTDSYVKWGAALLGSASADWDVELLVLDTPSVVSDAQLHSALAGSGMDAAAARRVTFDELEFALTSRPPDAVLVAARGPLARVVARTVAERAPFAVIVTGLPGISIPATRKALLYRAQCDVFVVHSHREVREFDALAERIGLPQSFALASLPFAGRDRAAHGDDLVFAAQALVPAERSDRLRIAAMLLAAARAHPDRRVVVKLRAERGEHQTHAEADPYPELLERFAPLPSNLVISTAPMRAALDSAEGLVTVSSTAAIEAVARGIPVIALDSFGIAPELINVVFEGSGLFGDEVDAAARRFRHPDPSWIHDNYLHDPADDDWTAAVAELVERRREGLLPHREPLSRRGGSLRDTWERKRALGPLDRSAAGRVALVLGVPLRAALVAAQRARAIAAPRPAATAPRTPQRESSTTR